MPKASPGCHNCRRRRIACDQTRPQCNKCLRKGIECSGYGVRYRFNDGIASRGKLTGCRVPVGVSKGVDPPRSTQPASLPNLSWPDGTMTSAENLKGSEVLSSEMTQNYPQVAAPGERDSDHHTVHRHMAHASQSKLVVTRHLLEQTGLSPRVLGGTRTTDYNSVPKPLALIDWPTQKLFAHFSNVIAPNMVVLDGGFNGYRNLLLPLAHGDDLVRAAVRVVSQYHLSSRQPELQVHADQGLQLIIEKLRQRTVSRSDLLDLSAWATVIILLTGETATGNSNFPYLFKVLQYLGRANMEAGIESILHTFLSEQTRMMTLFAQPLLGQDSGIVTLRTRPERYFDFMNNAALFNPCFQPQIEMYKSAIHHACNIYLVRATYGPPHAETAADVEALRLLCEQIDPNTPGHHALVWVYFIAAAESSTFVDRNFFTLRLQEIFSRTHFHNIPTALSALQDLWKTQDERKWTETLPEVMPVFII